MEKNPTEARGAFQRLTNIGWKEIVGLKKTEMVGRHDLILLEVNRDVDRFKD